MTEIKEDKIIVRAETHYGRQTVYPVCETANTFAAIAGTKTLTARVIKLIRNLGYQIEVQAPELELKNLGELEP
jgi:hypothetical protein